MRWPLPARFLGFLIACPLAFAALAPWVARWSQAVLGGFDLAALGFIGSLLVLTRARTAAQMRAHAAANDARRLVVLIITGLVMAAVVVAVGIEMPDAQRDKGLPHALALALVLGSLIIAWLFSNLVYALHYAHMYYRGHAEGGLDFPGMKARDETPTYTEFVYFALTIGMAFATSDVAIQRSDIRRIVTLHAAAAFFYNLVVLAFTINFLAGSS